MTDSQKYYGKYRGTVLNNVDPMQMGRLMVTVPDVSSSLPSSWALPCLPVTGNQTGLFTMPVIGSGVWVEFEQGNPDFPIWVGGFWGSSSEVPPMAKQVSPPIAGLCYQTPQKNGLIVTDSPGQDGGIILKSASGVSITVNDTGIYIKNGQGASIVLKGSKVTINDGAMEIT